MIRRASILDLDSIAKIESTSFKNPWSKEDLRLDIEENKLSYVYVITKGEDVIGYMSYLLIIDEAHINNIAILKEYRGRGYGKELVGKIVSDLLKHNISITLEVRYDNIPAIKLYESLGFISEGIRKDYYGSGESALIMWNRGEK